MDNRELVTMILAAVLVGSLVPVFVMLTLVLQSLRKRIESTGGRVDQALDGVQEAVDRANRVSSGIDGLEKPVAELVEMLDELTTALADAKNAVKTATLAGAVVGPAVAAFVGSLFRNTVPEEERTREDAGEEAGRDKAAEAGGEEDGP